MQSDIVLCSTHCPIFPDAVELKVLCVLSIVTNWICYYAYKSFYDNKPIKGWCIQYMHVPSLTTGSVNPSQKAHVCMHYHDSQMSLGRFKGSRQHLRSIGSLHPSEIGNAIGCVPEMVAFVINPLSGLFITQVFLQFMLSCPISSEGKWTKSIKFSQDNN